MLRSDRNFPLCAAKILPGHLVLYSVCLSNIQIAYDCSFMSFDPRTRSGFGYGSNTRNHVPPPWVFVLRFVKFGVVCSEEIRAVMVDKTTSQTASLRLSSDPQRPAFTTSPIPHVASIQTTRRLGSLPCGNAKKHGQQHFFSGLPANPWPVYSHICCCLS